MSTLKQCDVTDLNSSSYHPYATCCGNCEKFEREKPYQARLLAQHIADAKQSELNYRLKSMKRFNALKQVTAAPMTREEYNDLRGWELPSDEVGADDGYITVDITELSNLEGYDGYVSWTPKAMFDGQFYEADEDFDAAIIERYKAEVTDMGDERPIKKGDEFDFGSAIYLLKIGKKVARKGWNGSGMFVYFVPASSYPVERNNLETMGGIFPDDMVPYREYLALKTAQGDVSTWAPSVSDALATDWMLA